MSEKVINEHVQMVSSPYSGQLYRVRTRYVTVEIDGRDDDGAMVYVENASGNGSEYSRYVTSMQLGFGGIRDAVIDLCFEHEGVPA